MRFSLTPPPPKALHSSTITTTTTTASQPKWNSNRNGGTSTEDTTNSNKISNSSSSNVSQPDDDESTSDYKQWLHAMKLVARLPGGIPPEFRRKLWLSLADKYLKSKNVDWTKEEEKCFCEKWREDDEELGIQIVKDLHRTGSTLCTGPAGDINQAKLKRILLGYARYNPEVGYCQGFNMLGALILQVMDKDETESMKVMIYLVEGILPPGYFCGSMGGLQADMAVFRELMQTKLPRLARHLQKLQGPVENAYEPPLTNVFTMQWFLTMFCTCLPMSCVLRVWDLVLIEGSDVLLRTALALWSLLEDRVLSTRSADDFYGKMGSFSSELLNGHLIDSNGLIEKVVQLGPIQDIQKLRDKHLYSVSPLKNKQGLNLYYDDEEPDMDEDSRLAVATVWGIPWGRRGSQGQTSAKQAAESKDRIALDISLLKKQYDRLRERQKQAHIILTTACSTARQTTANSAATIPVNQLLSGRPAIVTNRGRRTGPPPGAIPPARKPSLPAVLQDNKPLNRQLRRGETIQWRDNVTDPKRRRDSLTWKEIRAERAAMLSSGSIDGLKSQKIRTKRLGKSDSSSYSEESEDDDKAASSSDTSLCDDENPPSKSARKYASKAALIKQRKLATESIGDAGDRQRPKSWAPSNSEIPFVLMTTDSPSHSADEELAKKPSLPESYLELSKKFDEHEEEEEEAENSATESDQLQMGKLNGAPYSPLANEDLPDVAPKVEPLLIETDIMAPSSKDIRHLTPPITDVVDILAISKVLANPPSAKVESLNSLGSNDGDAEEERKSFGVSDEGVTNEYFERVNSSERPTKLELMYSLNEEDSIRDAYKDDKKSGVNDEEPKKGEESNELQSRRMDLLVDYSEKSSAACIAEAKTEISSTLQRAELTQEPAKPPAYVSSAAAKRRDPRRLTLTRSTTMEIEERYQALEKRMSMEVNTKYGKKETEEKEEQEKYRSYPINGRRDHDEEPKSITREQGEGIQREHFQMPHFPKYTLEQSEPKSRSYENPIGEESTKPKESFYQPRYHIPSLETKSRESEESRSRENLYKRGEEDERKYEPSETYKYRSYPHEKYTHSRNSISSTGHLKDPELSRSYHHTNRISLDEEKLSSLYEDSNSSRPYHVERLSRLESHYKTHSKSFDRPHPAPASSTTKPDELNDVQRKPVIPSTADLEERFENMIRDRSKQIAEVSDSEKGRSSKKSPPPQPPSQSRENPQRDSTRDNAKRSQQTSNTRQSDSSRDDVQSQGKQSDRESDYAEEQDNVEEEELGEEEGEEEDLADGRASVASSSVPKSSTRQRKKEPPDTENEFSERDSDIAQSREALSDEEERSITVSGHDTPVEDSEPELEAEEEQEVEEEIAEEEQEEEPQQSRRQSDLKISRRPSEQATTSRRQSQLSVYSRRQSHSTDDRELEDRSTRRSSKASRKSPPSTEELEKRFEALEKQMSITRSEASEDPLEESTPRYRPVEYDDRQSPDGYSELDEQQQQQQQQMEVEEDGSEAGAEEEETVEDIARSQRIKAHVIEAMKGSGSAFASDDEDETSRHQRMAANVREAMKKTKADDAEKEAERKRRSDKLKLDVLEAMKSASALPSPEEGATRSQSSMAANVMKAMKSSSARHTEGEEASPERSTRAKKESMASSVMDAMKSSSAKQQRSDKIKADMIAAMKSAGEEETSEKEEVLEASSSKMASNVMAAMKSSSRSDKIKAGIIASMKSATTPDEPAAQTSTEEPTRKLSRSEKIKAGIIASMKSATTPDEPTAQTPTEELQRKQSRSDKIKAGIIASMKSAGTPEEPEPETPTEESTQKPSRSDRIKAGIIASMKSATTPEEHVAQTPTEELQRKQSRSEKIKAGIIASMKSATTPDEPVPQTPTEEIQRRQSRSDKIKAGIIASMKSGSTPDEPTAETPTDESAKKLSRSDKIKAGIIASMKSGSTPEEPEPKTPIEEAAKKLSRSDKMKAGIIASMKSGTTPDEPEPETPTPTKDVSKSLTRSDKIKAGIIASMKSGSTPEEPKAETPTEEAAKKLSRSDKIKAGIIASMKSATTPEEQPPTPEAASKSQKSLSSQPSEDSEKRKRSNKIKAEVISAMKSDHSSAGEGKMASNVMAAMKSSAQHTQEKVKRTNKIKADVIEAMKPHEESQKQRSHKMATNVMETMKSSVKRKEDASEKPSKTRPSPTKEEEAKQKRSQKIKSDVIEAMKGSSQTPEEKSHKMATNVMETMKSHSTRRTAGETSSKAKAKAADESAKKAAAKTSDANTSAPGSRRSSEPPSTEDLEKRYEVLKRRMSSRKDSMQDSQVKPKTSPPSTDSLERRFEKLQSDKTISSDAKPKKPKPSESPKSIPTPPTPPKDWSETEQSSPSQEPSTRSALIEELQAKMGPTPNGENIKPSSINPNRKTPAMLRKSKTDETSETHANAHANNLSEKRYELLHPSGRKMVRRFSDLPSRADLENRLLFLEEQLNRTLLKQRRASDSEVASTSRQHQQRHYQPIKPIPATIRHVGKLESRVLELERQLSAGSKFKTTTTTTESQNKNLENSAELSSSQMDLEIRADSVNVTGKELVRYNNYGELQEQDFQSPINISINIHMTLSKEELGKAATQSLTRAEELSRRLLILEEQLKNSQRIIASTATPVVEMTRELGAPPESSQENVQQEADNVPQKDEGEDEIVIPEDTKVASEDVAPQESAEIRESEKDVLIEEGDASKQEIPKEEEEKSEEKKEEKPTPEAAKEVKTEELRPEPLDKKEVPSEPLDKAMAEKLEISNMEEKAMAEKLERSNKDNDFDRRLQILEEHIKHSKPIKIPETHGPKEVIKNQNEAKPEEEKAVEPKKEATKEEKEVENKTVKETEVQKAKEKEMQEAPKETKKEASTQEEKTDIKETSKTELPIKEIPKKSLQEDKAQISDRALGHLHGTQMVPVEVNKKTLVLLLDNEPKAVKVRRLTRANTEELEDLFQALEKQLLERGQIKPEDVGAKDPKSAQEMSDLTKEIMQLSKTAKEEATLGATSTESSPKKKSSTKPPEEDFDWGKDPVKHHLRKKTVYLPSTRELESRFRSLERQIKMLEDVEKIDVEQRLTEIERKIKLQYSLSHEKDLNRFLDLCEGKGLDDIPGVGSGETPGSERCSSSQSQHQQQQHSKKHQSPVRFAEAPECCDHHCHCSSSPAKKKEHQSPVRSVESPQHHHSTAAKPTTEDLEYRFRAMDLHRKSRPRTKNEPKREPIHPLEMLLDPSPDDIPTTGELEHRMKMLEEGRTPSPSALKSRSKSPASKERDAAAAAAQQVNEPSSPSGLPTAEQLEARLEALEREQRFDFKMQKNYKEFNQKLKDIISPSLSFEEFRATRSSSAESAKRNLSSHRSPSPKVAVAQCTGDAATCPNKTIRFHDDDEQLPQHHQQQQQSRTRHDTESMVSTNSSDVIQILEENSNILQRILKKSITDTTGATSTLSSVPPHLASSVQEGLGVMGIRLMRETSPLRRKGTHTGVPLRTGENINDQLTSIRSTIKSIDSLCEEKPYRTERCLQYIDSLCSDSNYFASKKSSYDDLRSRHSSRSRSRDPYGGPSIRISDQSSAYMRTTMGSADSIRSSSPRRATSPLQYHSNRDLRREISPRRRRNEEDREENESRVRRDNLLPNSLYYPYNHSSLSPSSHSLTKFHKVDSQLIATNDDVDCIDVEIQQIYRQATTTTAHGSTETTTTAAMSIQDSNTNTSLSNNNTQKLSNTTTANLDSAAAYKGSLGLDRPISPYRQLGISRSNTPVYTPAKLEIRHTTVTSTFYDRVLTEKQLEKKLSQNSLTATSTSTNTTTTTSNGSTIPPTNSAQRSPIVEQVPPLKPLDTFSLPTTVLSVSESATTAKTAVTVTATEPIVAATVIPPYASYIGIEPTSLTDTTISNLPSISTAPITTGNYGSFPPLATTTSVPAATTISLEPLPVLPPIASVSNTIPTAMSSFISSTYQPNV
ncbi:microtubule-associated protein futsch [Musca vetustissima]|uniref:microtubule-associated protein futsch n=1 Tax=Musca vetustissima TaxID=27455 RepID=UPI002AB6DB0F|nr:microtubule-associated protein futsch [Musca vetustissima]